jgi:hypothetical protein
MREYINKVKNFEQFFNENSTNSLKLIHITTPEIANNIKKNGFLPKPYIEYQYYSDLGKNGIYFYNNKRQAQFYAGFLIGKTKVDKVALISVDAPSNIVINSEKTEDGYFIKSENLDGVKINNIDILKYSEIY